MRKTGLRKLNILWVVLCLLLSGCAGASATLPALEMPSRTKSDDPLRMLSEGVVDYEVTPQLPGILVDLNGYEINSDKEAVMEGVRLPSTFTVKDSTTNETVFFDTVHVRSCPEDGETMSAVADFSAVKTPGTYYIEAEYLGRSRDFVIGEGIDRKILEVSFAHINEYRNLDNITVSPENDKATEVLVTGGWFTDSLCGQDVTTGCLTALDMMIAYEYHPEIYTDDFGILESGDGIPDVINEIAFEMNWLMNMQNKETGGVNTGIYFDEESGKLLLGGETTKATAYAATTLARFSYIVRKFDATLSTKCLTSAGLAWKCLIANKDIVTPEQLYRAAVELYRATGYSDYKAAIENYLKDNYTLPYESRITLDGAITYMATAYSTNVTYCTALMDTFMTRTESCATQSHSGRYFIKNSENLGEILRIANELIMVDYIISNREYELIERNHLHYVGGRNHESINYTDKLESPDEYAMLMLIAGKLCLNGDAE